MSAKRRCHATMEEAEHREYHARYYRANRDKWVTSSLAKKYGLTPEAYAAMLAAQGGRCAICGEAAPSFVVDHDHKCCPGRATCGQCIRALLCPGCNVGIGHLKEDAVRLRAAADYIERHG